MLEQIFISDDAVRDPAKSAHSPIRNFFRGKTVFLTGGTGFLGKLFIEKLLQCEVREIVLLIRSKRGRTPRERLQRQLEREPVRMIIESLVVRQKFKLLLLHFLPQTDLHAILAKCRLLLE